MPVALTFDTRDAAPEAIREHLAEREGKFIFEAEPLSVVTSLNGKLTKLRGDLDAKTAKLGKYTKLEELGDEFDADEFLTLRELKKQGKPLTADEKAELERQHQKQIAKFGNDLKDRDSRITAMEGELKHYKLTVPLRNIALKAGVLPEDVELALLETQSRFRLGEDGKKIVVIDTDGDPTDITPETFFGKLYKEQRPKFYAASAAGGSGAQNKTSGGTGSSKTMSREQFEALDQAGRMKAAKDGIQVVD